MEKYYMPSQIIPDDLARQLEINFEEGFWDWQDIQGSNSMDFPVKWDNLMHQIEAWKLGKEGNNG